MVTRRLACAAFFTLSSGFAEAQSPAQRMFPTDAQCYTQAYDAAHLAGHPAQRVTRIALIQDRDVRQPLLGLLVQIGLRGETVVREASSFCAMEGAVALACRMEDGAGGFTMQPARDGQVLLRVSPQGMEFGDVTLEPERADDRAFLLRPVVCR